MKYAYTAVISYDKESNKYFCKVPDLPDCITSGKDIADAIDMITDAASLWLVEYEDQGRPAIQPTPYNQIEHDLDDICTIILIDTLQYRAQIDSRAVRKTVSLPAWMFRMADKAGINCSQVLQESLMQRFQ